MSTMSSTPDKKKPLRLPIFCIRDNILFPGMEENIDVGRKISINAIKTAVSDFGGQIIILCQKKSIHRENITSADLFHVGVVADVIINKEYFDKTWSVNFKVRNRIEVNKIISEKGFLVGTGLVVDADLSGIDADKILEEIQYLIQQFNKKIPEKSFQIGVDFWKKFSDPQKDIVFVVDSLAGHPKFKLTPSVKQKILTARNLQERLKIIFGYLEYKLGNEQVDKEIRKKIQSKIQSKVHNQQREYILRERLRAIQEELAKLKGKSPKSDRQKITSFKEQLRANPYPKAIKERIQYEINRYENSPHGSNESYLIFDYINWVMGLPWFEHSKEATDLTYAKKILDSRHYGLKKPKARIIEFLAVKQFQNKVKPKAHIICLVGPPGVGKTSLARSIAEATGRKFVKISLGGMRDEAEIRGHRRTYIGAMPGRIIKAMKKAKVVNPVFLLDEIDKVDSGFFKGDPADALLEVLDPEQNAHFIDNYIDEEYNLQHVFFVATANYLANIPEPLMDRMEIIPLSSYTELEKFKIANDYLIPQVLASCQLKKKDLKFRKAAILEIIHYYTREAGVRELERCLEAIMRKFLVKKLKQVIETLDVTAGVVQEYLGKRKYEYNLKGRAPAVGLVTGLAYTAYGGDTLPIEVNFFPGEGKLVLTGKLGEIMRESAAIALDYIKANAQYFKINYQLFLKNDIHIHVPEGAVPKDGPSAGITLTTAIISALTKKTVASTLGMTGEITLRGNVLPIGGLKEKLISANRSGLTQVIIPARNAKDLVDVPETVKKKLTIHMFSHYREVFKLVFQK